MQIIYFYIKKTVVNNTKKYLQKVILNLRKVIYVMFSIAICDDEIKVCSQLEKIFKPYISSGEIKIEIYYTGESLLKSLFSGSYFDLIFLDIELEKINGVNVGKKIRTELSYEQIQIVYISAKQEYAMELFAIRPMNFILKPIYENEIIATFMKAVKLSKEFSEYFEFKNKNELFRIPYGDIIYFESKNRKVVIYTKKCIKEIYCKLNLIDDMSPPSFIRVHQSFLVNSIYINRWRFNEIVIVDDNVLPISKPYRKRVSRFLLQT